MPADSKRSLVALLGMTMAVYGFFTTLSMLLAATIPQLQSNLRQDPKPLNGEKIEISSPFALWTLFSLWWFRIS
jgi:hypothetical protein